MRRRRARHAVGIGGGMLVLLLLLALGAPLVWPTAPNATDLGARLASPSVAHPLGQDALGRDQLARLLSGARAAFAVAAAAVSLAAGIGIALGALAGWYGGWVDALVARAVDVLLAFPGLLLAIALAAALGPSRLNVVLALAVMGWPGYARLTRTQIAVLRRRELAEAALALGATPARVVGRHLLPLAAPTLLVHATFGLSGAVLAEASLSFLGLGAPPPAPSWGGMLDDGRQFLLVAPHLVVAPGAALAATVLALQLLGDGLGELLDVRATPSPGADAAALTADSADTRTSTAR